MTKFFLIGLGLKPEHLSLEALEAIKSCDKLFLDNYTSAYSQGSVTDLEKIIGKKIVLLSRKELESDFLINEAKKSSVALLVFGSPLTATTHIELLIQAKQKKLNPAIIVAPSISSVACQLSGLQEYKFGQIVTIVFWKPNFEPESFVEKIYENKKLGLHSLCLLDLDLAEKKFMSINEALVLIEKIEKKNNSKIIQESIIVGLAGLASVKQQIAFGSFQKVKNFKFKQFPQCLIVAGNLNEKEKESLEVLSETA